MDKTMEKRDKALARILMERGGVISSVIVSGVEHKAVRIDSYTIPVYYIYHAASGNCILVLDDSSF